MFCENCGAENVDEANFCKKCGAPMDNSDSVNPGPVGAVEITDVSGADEMPGAGGVSEETGTIAARVKKPMSKAALAGIAVGILALIYVVYFEVYASKIINLDKYLTIEAEGYDGYGTAGVIIDWNAIEAKHGSKISFSNAAKKQYGDYLKKTSPIDVLEDSISLNLDTSSNLSNGDVIAYTWNIDDEISKYLNCKVKFKNGDYTVSGLEKIDTFDAFADLTVDFAGTAPNGRANLNYTGTEINNYDFKCNKTSGLRNGDTIIVTIDSSNLDYYVKNFGKIPAEMEKEYQVKGLESCIEKLSEIDESAFHSMQQQATDVYYAKMAKDWADGEDLESFTYMGDYLLTSKDEDYLGTNSYLFLVYKAQVRNYYSNDEESYNELNDVYWYIRYEDLMSGSDGATKVDVTNYSTPNNRFTVDSGVESGWWNTKTWSYYGYKTLDALYKNVVTANMDSYNHEDNVTEAGSRESTREKILKTEAFDNGYVLSDSSTKRLSRKDLTGLSAEDCKIARNEIYARHGRKFNDESLQSYFDSCSWYEGTIEPDDFDEMSLSDIEIANKDLIVEYEKDKGYR